MSERTYGRKYMRIKPESPVFAEITIVCIGQSKVTTGTAKVRIIDLSPGGLSFVSPLNFPVDDRLLIEFSFTILDYTFKLTGNIIYKTCLEVNEYEYGFCFSEANEDLRSCLKKLFNNMCIRMNRHIVFLKLS